MMPKERSISKHKTNGMGRVMCLNIHLDFSFKGLNLEFLAQIRQAICHRLKDFLWGMNLENTFCLFSVPCMSLIGKYCDLQSYIDLIIIKQ